MNELTIHHEAAGESLEFQRRADSLGLCLLSVEPSGQLLDHHAPAEAWVEKLLAGWQLFETKLRETIRQWPGAKPADPVELWPGCWLIPVPDAGKRRRAGRRLALAVGSNFSETEQFVRLCDVCRLDVHAAAARLAHRRKMEESDGVRLAGLLQGMAADIDRIARQDNELMNLSNQLSETYEELSLLYRLSSHMNVTRDQAQFLADLLGQLQQVLGLEWMAMRMIGDGSQKLKSLSDKLLQAGYTRYDERELRLIGRLLMEMHGAVRAPIIISDPPATGIRPLATGCRSLLIMPIHAGPDLIGIVFGADKIDRSDITNIDSKLLASSLQNTAIFLENAILYEDSREMFMGTLHALVSSIDAKDAYTCGHSERVAHLARELARAAGLDEQTVDRIHLSGLVHDVGKIGVPESVLTKPGGLTDEEFGLIKQHPEIGARILRDIPQMQDLIPGVLHHHERWDGRGYPYKLAGEAIPLFGRIIGIADSFDAMSSNRTYRAAMPLERVLDEIRKCAGAQFDPKLAETFVTLNFEEFTAMVAFHQQRGSLVRQALRSEIGERKTEPATEDQGAPMENVNSEA